MKNLKLLLAAFILTACSNDEPPCNCTAEYTNGNGSYYITHMPIDCETGQPTEAPTSGGWFVGCSN